MIKNKSMYALCIESSKNRGMGHLFRLLLYVEYLQNKNIDYIILINNDINSISILEEKNLSYEIVDYYNDYNWVTNIINKYNITVWVEDKFETSDLMGQSIKKNNILFCCIDDFSYAANYSDINFAGMLYLTGNTVYGNKQYKGTEYVVLNSDINKYRKEHKKLQNIIVTLGGSDPFGATVEVIEELIKTNYNVEIVIGPNFAYKKELEQVNMGRYEVKQNIPSLIEEIAKFDFAITGGGGTCCEANALGVPCLIIANAPHEVFTGKHMQKIGGAIYAGLHGEWDRNIISRLHKFDIRKMSNIGLKTFDTCAVERIFNIIKKEEEVYYERK